jgi:octaprenyl-diphosphate synthase
MYLVGTLGGKHCLELICRATEAMVAGEFLQLANAHNLNQSESDYFAVIDGKTALFIGAVCEIGGLAAGADNPETEQLKQYGANLGLAFQIQDDLLDYLGDTAKTGKSVGNDFFEGKMTLPLLHTLTTAGDSERNFLLELLRGDSNGRRRKFSEARKIIHDNGGFEYSAKLAERLVEEATRSLMVFTSGQNQETIDILTGLAGYVITRDR